MSVRIGIGDEYDIYPSLTNYYDQDHPAGDIDDIGTLKVSNVEFKTETVDGGIELIKDAAIAYVPYENNAQVPGAIYQMGRSSNIGL